MNIILLEHHEDSDINRISEIAEAFSAVVSSAPEFNVQRCFSYVTLSGSIAAAKKVEKVWSFIPGDVQNKLDLMMELFLYSGAYATHVDNNYQTGFKWKGHWNKRWAPNHRITAYGPMYFAIEYFGGIDAANEKLANFDFDSVMERVKAAGFTRCYDLWTAPAVQLDEDTMSATVKDLLENGGEAFVKDRYGNVYSGGSGVSIRTPYRMSEHTGVSTNIITHLTKYCYQGGPCLSRIDMNDDGVIDAYILDGTTSPMEGQDGMMLEFKTTSGAGLNKKFRSSINFCEYDYIMMSCLIAYNESFRKPLAESHPELLAKAKVGNADFLYKLEHGFIGQANDTVHKINANEHIQNPHTTITSWANYWNTYLV